MVPLSSIFTIQYGVNLELNSLTLCKKGDKGAINFVSRTSKNNGISAIVKRIEGLEPIPAGTLSVAGGGSVLETNLQLEPYYSGRDLYYLTPIKPMSNAVKLYYCMVLKANKYRYNFGRQANATLGIIEVPGLDEIPEWVEKIKPKDISHYAESLEEGKDYDIDFKNWKQCKVSDLFDSITQCKCGNAEALIAGEDIWYIGAKKRENGTMKKVAKDENLVSKGNCMILIGDGQGSVGCANYMDRDFIGSTTLYAAYSKELDKYVGMFLATMFNFERYRYNYGRKWNGNRLLDSSILLPVVKNDKGVALLNNKGNFIPDYNFMREYIKSLPFSKEL